MEQTIGKYKIVREIGKGGMGIVYKGLDPASQRSVAIKVLPSAMVDKATVERFHREAHAMSRLKHPNLVEVYEVGMTKGQHFYAMEYVEGETLKAVIRHRGRLSVADCLGITAQVADALAVIHAEGMIHRDIKPGNIMVTPDKTAKLMDFGLVQVAEMTRLTVEGSSVGTAEYMSPEQISDNEVDSRSDLYSLGATMYEMLAGRPPFEGETLQAILMKQKYEKPDLLRSLRPDVPAELERIVHKALAKDLPQRYQRVRELMADLAPLGGRVPPRREKTVSGKEEGPARVSPSGPPLKISARKSSSFSPVPLLAVVVVLIGGYWKRDAVKDALRPIWEKFPFGSSRPVDLTGETENYLDKLQAAEKHYERGRDLYRQGRTEETVAEYRKAIELRRDYPLYYKELAGIYEETGQKGRAVRTWKNLLKYAPSGAYAQEAQQAVERLAR